MWVYVLCVHVYVVFTCMSAYTCVWMYMCACLWREEVDTTCLCCLLPVLQFEVNPSLGASWIYQFGHSI